MMIRLLFSSLSATKQKPVNYSLIAILVILAVVVSAIWLFGLDTKLFGSSFPKSGQKISVSAPVESQSENSKMMIEESKPNVKQDTTESIVAQNEPSQSVRSMTVKSEVSEFDKIRFLESKQFELNLSGTSYVGSPSLSKPTSLELTIAPIVDSNMEKFNVLRSQFFIDGTGINLGDIQVVIKGTQLVINSTNNGLTGARFTLVGVLDESILDDKDKEQKAILENQLLFLTTKPGGIPQHLDLRGTLKYQ
jgi:hypothetical protein